VLRNENILAAYKRAKKNKGAAGVDGMKVDELEAYCRTHWREIREELRNGSYKPQPVLMVEIP
jgi:RNA-directed DNA polymerase